MQLTPQEEEKLIKKYSKLIWRQVEEFIHKGHGRFPSPMVTEEDYYQECVAAFLEKARTMSSVEDLKTKFPFNALRKAMQRCLIRSQSLCYPVNTSYYPVIWGKEAKKNSLPTEELHSVAYRGNDIKDVATGIDFERFFAELSDFERQVVVRKLNGQTNGQIAQEFGLTPVQMTRFLRN